jgi:hypothetical protein
MLISTATCGVVELPRTEILEFHDPADVEGSDVEFRLIYEGPLSSDAGGGGRAKEKQRLRKHFHPQLRELWKQHPNLREQSGSRFVRQTSPRNQVSYPGGAVEQIVPAVGNMSLHPDAKSWLDHIADDYQRCGGRFVPLISKAGGFTCALEILFLRRDNPGHLIASGGDIDNRLKLLFDGLRMPGALTELGGIALEPDENPFFLPA